MKNLRFNGQYFYIHRIGFAHIGRVGSVFLTVAITIERYVSVCHPTEDFKGKCCLIPLPIIAAILYNIPKFFEIETTEKSDTTHKFDEPEILVEKLGIDSNLTEMQIKVEDLGYRGTQLRLNYWYVILYVTWSKLLLVDILPWITIIILNILIWRKIRKFQEVRTRVFQKNKGK